MDDYRSHLGQLITLVQACAKTRDLQNCDPLLVGPDDRIPLSGDAQAERRLVRYGWLRVLFSRAEEPDESTASSGPAKKNASPAGAQPAPPSTSKLLLDAERRLASDLAQAGTSIAPEPSYPSERATMAQVLAGRDFRDLEQPSVRDSMLEKVNNWLNHLIQNVTKWRARSAWVGRVVVWGFILAVCIALIWTLLQLERRWRVRLAQRSGVLRHRRLPPRAAGNCGSRMRVERRLPVCGAKPFISSIGPALRGLKRAGFGLLIAPARRGSISRSFLLPIRATQVSPRSRVVSSGFGMAGVLPQRTTIAASRRLRRR